MKKGFIEIDENDIRAIERLRDFLITELPYVAARTVVNNISAKKLIATSNCLTDKMHSALKGDVIKCINENYAKGIPKCQSWCGEDYCKQPKESKK